MNRSNLPGNKRKGGWIQICENETGGISKKVMENGPAAVIDDFRDKSYTKFTVEGD